MAHCNLVPNVTEAEINPIGTNISNALRAAIHSKKRGQPPDIIYFSRIILVYYCVNAAISLATLLAIY